MNHDVGPVTRALESFLNIPGMILMFIKDHLVNVSAHTLGWLTIVMLHLRSVPTLLAVLTHQSDRMPPVDIMLFIWGGLIAIFFKMRNVEKGCVLISKKITAIFAVILMF